MDVQQLNELSYKELQAYAKQYSIPANQKKEVLIAEILSGAENNENAPIQANKIVVPVTPSAKPSRVTRSTVKKGLVMKDEADVDSLTVQVLSLKVEPVAEKEATPVKEEKISAPIDTIVESPLAAEESIAIDAAFPTPCVDAEEVAAEEEADDVEYPTPTKLFENNEPFEYNEQGKKISINRHVYFTSPDAKGGLTELAEQGQKHMHFASPELQMGKNVHWRYEDYNTTSAEEVIEEKEEEEPVEQDEQSVASESSEVNAKPSRMNLPAGHSDRVMSFWLTKAFANPINNFFK